MAVPVALIIEGFLELARAGRDYAELVEANRKVLIDDETAAAQIRETIANLRAFKYRPVTPAEG